MVRRPTAAHFEGMMAMLKLAAFRVLTMAVHSATASSNTSYTVQNEATRRVVCFFSGTILDIHFNHNAAASANTMPLKPADYVTVDAVKGDTVQFYNTTGGAINVYICEVD